MRRFLLTNAGEKAEAVRRVAGRFPTLTLVEAPQNVDVPTEPIDAEIEFTPQGLIAVPRGVNVDGMPVGWLWAPEARFAPSSRAIKRSLEAGDLGAVGLVRIHDWLAPGDCDLDGRLAQQLDLACWLAGTAPSIVAAHARGDDYVQAHLGYPGGGMAVIDCATCLPAGSPGYRSLSVIGSAGAAYADDHRNLHLAMLEGGPRAIFSDEGDAALIAAFTEFLSMLASGGSPSCSAAEWRRAKMLWKKVQESLAASAPVLVDEASP